MKLNDETLQKLALAFMTVLMIIIPVLFYFLVMAFLAKSYAVTAFLIGISFVLVAQLIYYFERAFTPGEVWRTRDSYMVRFIGDKRAREKAAALEEESADSGGRES
jgi:hypothetical protein